LAVPRALEQAAFGREPVLELAHISLSFKGVRALSDVGLQVVPGEICGLIGPNGAGKSSLLNVMSGVYRQNFYLGQAAAEQGQLRARKRQARLAAAL
jgi:branched-chain amino acid transport system ATP-binding protein